MPNHPRTRMNLLWLVVFNVGEGISRVRRQLHAPAIGAAVCIVVRTILPRGVVDDDVEHAGEDATAFVISKLISLYSVTAAANLYDAGTAAALAVVACHAISHHAITHNRNAVRCIPTRETTS